MATSVHSGEDSAAHTATDQWQSFEMRMRQRRVERLFARAATDCQEGREDAAREALAEIERLNAFEPRLPELRMRVEGVRAGSVAAIVAPPVFSEPRHPEPALSPSAEFTSSIETPSIADQSLIDLPLVIGEQSDASEPAGVDVQQKRSGRGLALAAAALLACGAIGWFVGPKVSTLMQTPRTATAGPNVPAALPSSTPADPAEALQPAEAPPPVHVAVEEIPAASAAVEPARDEPEPLPQPSSPAASVELRSTAPLVRDPIAATTGSETPAPPEPPPPAPISALPQDAVLNVEKPAPVPAVADPTPPPAAAAAAPAAAREEEKIRDVLDRYASAYSQLDATAATAIFPGLDRRALARAFDGLASQNVSLGSCDVRIAIDSAIVDCAGRATWTPKIGGGSRTEPRRWQFRLRNASGEWQMVAAKVR